MLHGGHASHEPEAVVPHVPAVDDSGATQLLPDLTPVVNANLGYLHGWVLDTTSQPGRVLLRLTGTIANVGAGPLEIRGGRYTDPDHREVFQRVTSEGGGFSDRLAGTFVAHPEHGHIHFEDFAEYRLREVNPGEGVGAVVRNSGKVSFCLLDEVQTPHDIPHAVADRTYVECGDDVQGISVGWADVYERTLPDQWVDVTGVAPGRYWLEVAANPSARLAESDHSNNEARVLIELDPASSTPFADRMEPNGSLETASDLGALGDLVEPQLSIGSAGDQDFFRFTAASTGTVTVALTGATGAGTVRLALLDSAGAELASAAMAEADAQVAAPLVGGQTYYVAVSSGGSAYASYTLTVQGIAPTVTIAAREPEAAEPPGVPGSFVITRNGPVNATLAVQYTVSGTATNGVDVATLSGSVVIPVRQSSVTVFVFPLGDGVPEGPETLTFALAAQSAYVVDGAAASATVTIADSSGALALPAPWTSGDVGPVGSAGHAGVLPNGEFRLVSAGGDPARGRRDVLQLASQALEGDGAVIARVAGWDTTAPSAFAGVTLRDGSAAGARGVTLAVDGAGNLQLIVRKSTNGKAHRKALAAVSDDAGGAWLRLMRVGRTVTAATSADGVTWQTLATVRTRLAARVAAGVVCGGAGDATRTVVARFEAPRVAAAPPAPSGLTAEPTASGVRLTWSPGDAVDGNRYVVERSTHARKRFSRIAERAGTATDYEDATLAAGRYFYRVRAIAPAGSAVGPAIVVRVP